MIHVFVGPRSPGAAITVKYYLYDNEIFYHIFVAIRRTYHTNEDPHQTPRHNYWELSSIVLQNLQEINRILKGSDL